MIAGVTVGVMQNFLWLGWCVANLNSRPYAYKIGMVVVLMFAGNFPVNFSHVI